jgi:hypothetical protein
VGSLVFATHDGEGVHDEVGIVSLDAVDVEERRIDLRTQESRRAEFDRKGRRIDRDRVDGVARPILTLGRRRHED